MRRIALLLPLLVLLPSTGVAAGPPTVPGARGCPIFPANNPWNERVDRLPVAADSAALVAAIGLDAPVHPDFGSFSRLRHPLHRRRPLDEARARVLRLRRRVGQGPLPAARAIRASRAAATATSCWSIATPASSTSCTTRPARARAGMPARARSGTSRSNHLRPAGWTSADAAGLPILPGLVRYDEVAAGAIRHALRFTASKTSQPLHLARAPLRRRRRREPASDGPARAPEGLRRHLALRPPGARRAAGAQDLRDDPRRQRELPGTSPARATGTSTTTTCTRSGRSPAPTSRSSTRAPAALKASNG